MRNIIDAMSYHSTLAKYLVEFFGTFFFLYVIISTGSAIAIGAALALVIFLGGRISGGDFNPAVTVMMVAANKMPLADALPYIFAQLAGAVAALSLYKSIGKISPGHYFNFR